MSTKKSLSWKEAGRNVAALVALFTLASRVLKKIKVGPEIIDWLTGSGKDLFSQKLIELGTEFQLQAPILRAEIDTNIDPRLPIGGATIDTHRRQGRVVIEKRVDGLYVDGHKVVLYRSPRQMYGNKINGRELRIELDGQTHDRSALSANVADFLFANQEYLPEDWKKKDENDKTIFILFWGTIYRRFDRSPCIRTLCWCDGQCHENCYWLGLDCYSNFYSAVLENK